VEYVISNVKLPLTKKFGDLFFSGDFNSDEDSVCLVDGFFKDYEDHEVNKVEINEILGNDKVGVYNYISYNRITNILRIKNDKFGMFTLYIYNHNSKIIISNNIWNIIKNLSDNELKLDSFYLKSYLYFASNPDEGKTIFKSIIQLPASSNLTLDISNTELKINRYWDLIHKPDEHLEINDAAAILDNDIKNGFLFFKSRYPDKVFGFGNSGGLDSRLIPTYANEANISLVGFTTGRVRSYRILYSITHRNAMKVAKIQNFPNKNIDLRTNILEDRLLLDIRNNPIGRCQMFKNPFESLPVFDNIFCGGDGFIISNNWQDLEKINDLQELKKYFRTKAGKARNLKTKESESHYNSLFTKEEVEQFNASIDAFVEKYSYKDNISLIRTFHQSILNKLSPNGGFESVSRTKKVFYMYYPFAFENTLNWKNDFFYDRSMLKSLISRKSKKLERIPDQNFNYLYSDKRTLYQKMVVKIRTNGLDYANWVNYSKFRQLSSSILYRPNPLYSSLVDPNNVINMKVLSFHPHVGLDFIKLKKIFDIIYFKEFDFVDNREFLIQ